jgi:MerR family Zn(II)-responsive transcriptional regulator of zntA
MYKINSVRTIKLQRKDFFIMTRQELLKVSEIAREAGVTLRTIRYYDELGLITPACRTDSNYRLYDKSSIRAIKLINNLKSLGFTLEEIKELFESSSAEEKTYMATIKRTRDILLAEKKKVEEQLKSLKKLSNDIENSLETIEKCFDCRKERGEILPCKPDCNNSDVHIKF